jgi:serine O-acetyltransferase
MDEFRKDFFRATGIRNKVTLRAVALFATQHQLRYMRYWRKHKRRKNLWTAIQLYRYSRKYGLEIGRDASIGPGLYLGHAYNITVSNQAVLGKNCSLHKGCTIGGVNIGKRAGAPRLGDCVYVGINSTITGNVTIGDDVLIAPNSFVNFDVPPHSVVIGNPGQIHHKDNATEGYIYCKVE